MLHHTPTPPPSGEPGYDPSTLHIPAAALAAMTEFNKQYWAIKSRAMDLVLFVRHGRCASCSLSVVVQHGMSFSFRAMGWLPWNRQSSAAMHSQK